MSAVYFFRKLFLSFICFLPTIALAYTYTDSIGLDLGVAMPTNAGESATLPLGYSTFSYSSNDNNNHNYIAGIAFNRLVDVAPLYSAQIGISYHYLSDMDVKGNLTQGIAPPFYQANYSYNINSSQYMIDAKLRRELQSCLYPYVYLGLGLAANRAFDFTTDVPAYLTVTPDYSNKTTYAFAYSLGVGIDYLVMSKLSVGIGYRFINLGNTELGTGTIRNTSTKAALSQSNLYVNSLLAQLNYFI
jgi:opacity protein-like surface antigen